MNISESTKSFLWLPHKTGTNNAVSILKNFGFKTYIQQNGNLFLYNTECEVKDLTGNHIMIYFEGHEKYDFICTARNPFSRLLSLYKFNHKDQSEWSPEHFQNYFNIISKRFRVTKFLWPFERRVPDYFIRLENLYDDYLKLPFIKNSEIHITGELKELCSKKINFTSEIKNPEEYFNDEIKNLIWLEGKKYFDLLGYEFPY